MKGCLLFANTFDVGEVIGYMNRVDWNVYPYDSNVDNECLSDTLGDTDSDVKSTFRKNNMNKIIFALLNIDFVTNKSDELSDIIKGHCVKTVRIRSYSGPHFPTFVLNTVPTSPYSVRMREIKSL